MLGLITHLDPCLPPLLAAPQLVPTVNLRGLDFKLLDSMFKPRAPAQRRTCPHALA